MAAYIEFTCERIRDASKLAAYAPKARASIEGNKITVRTAYGRHEVLEGPQVEGVYIMEFPSFYAAKEWYDSPADREAREHRFRGSDYRP